MGFSEGDIGLLIQRFFNPLWSLIFNGCYLNRNPMQKIKEAGFSDVQFEKYISRSFQLYLLSQKRKLSCSLRYKDFLFLFLGVTDITITYRHVFRC
ncbi:methyltransferase-like protein 7B [Trichonephila inaurata madagascariensis]|uniref:Methyltransferase-like protein 7B n=1 Tax=Trichonephila inaurata madagascariensis TaxID=2747483 RepID=A0A8X6YAR6_9ARAC|nr:methyltransferase-like protein 7B [Trichonephila inaurata madagascariensis]